MSDSPNLTLPYLVASQAQKEVTHNEGLNVLDMAVQPCIIAIQFTPPGSPVNGDVYLVGGGTATGAWATQETRLAGYYDGWVFLTPQEGWEVYNQADNKTYRYNGTGWVDVTPYSPSTPSFQTPTLLSPWIGYGGGFASPRYYKTAEGIVFVEGMIQAAGGTSTTDVEIFTLLAGYRPDSTLMFICYNGGGAYRVDVQSDGKVILKNANTAFTSLAGISFRIA
jgi:hypothetical protein